MRPAQKAPENRIFALSRAAGEIDFNEAGAKSAGKRADLVHGPSELGFTSMRPAQKAPENDFAAKYESLVEAALQ